MRRIVLVAALVGLFFGLAPGAGATTTPPSVPQTLFVHATAAGELTVQWTPPASDGGGGALTYTVTAAASSGPNPATWTGTALSTVFTGLTAGTSYAFSVTATNTSGTSQPASATAVATDTPMPPGTLSMTGSPQFLQTLAAAPAGWPTGTTYRYQWYLDSTPILGATAVSYRLSNPIVVGKHLMVSVVVSSPGFIDSAPQQATSAVIAPAPLPGFAYVGGHTTAGQTWYARTSGWPAGTTFAYQWSYDGQPAASTPSFDVPNHLLDQVSLTVTATPAKPNSGYTTTVTTLPPLRVQPANPLAGELWPADMSAGSWDHDLVWDYLHSTGTAHTLQAKIATRPRSTWFGGWNSPSLAASLVKGYIVAVQNGDPNSLVTLTLHTIWTIDGMSENTRNRPLTTAQRADYIKWMTAVATAIGTSRVAIIMEPDLAELPKAMTGTLNTADPGVRAKLVGQAVRLLARNPNAAIYLDSGDSDWQSVSTMVPWLKLAGIGYARGFALGATHYAKATDDINYGTAMVRALIAAGVTSAHTHYVIDTADNGQGFTWAQYAAKYGGGSFNNAAPCKTRSGPAPCASLGVPPTWQVIDTALPLSASQQFYALRELDGFLWFSRPWLPWQSGAYSPALGQQLAASSPYA